MITSPRVLRVAAAVVGRRIREQRSIQAKAFGRAPAEGALGMQGNKIPQPIRRGEAERLQPFRTLLAGIGKSARGEIAGSDDPDQASAVANGQQSGRCGFDHSIVVKRAIFARDAIETLVRGTKRGRQRRKVGLFGDGVGTDQHAFRTDADGFCPAFCRGDDPAGEQMADTVELRAAARLLAHRGMPMAARQPGRKATSVSQFSALARRTAAPPLPPTATFGPHATHSLACLDFSSRPR